MKKCLSIIVTLALAFSAAACGKNTDAPVQREAAADANVAERVENDDNNSSTGGQTAYLSLLPTSLAVRLPLKRSPKPLSAVIIFPQAF